MSNLKNSQVIRHVLQTLVSKIGRRTSEGFATVILDTVLNELRSRYDFLRYVEIKNTFYSEGIDAVSVSSEIDLVDTAKFYNAVGDIIEMTIKCVKEKADFFFIKEVQEALNDIYNLNLKEQNIDLNRMQFQFIVDKKQEVKMKNSEMVEIVISALNNIINQKFPGAQKTKTMINSIRKLGKKYDFLKHVEISDEPTSGGFYLIQALSGINNAHPIDVVEAIQKIICDIGESLDWKDGESFIETLKREIGEKHLVLEGMGVNLEHIKFALMRQGHELLVKKTLEALIDTVSKNTSEGFAVVAIDAAIGKLEEKHNILRYIKIDKSRYAEGANAISIMPDINNVESYKLGKAIREVIRMVGKELGSKTTLYIEDFKKHIGTKYLHEIEKIGVNLHFLELKFA
jgi:hypothetical protein